MLHLCTYVVKCALSCPNDQWSSPSTLNQVKGRGEEGYMTYGEHEALVRGKPPKLKLGSVFSFEMQSPTTFIPWGKDKTWECTRPKAPLKDINLPPLQRQIGTSPTTVRAFRKITMRSEKRKTRWRRAAGTFLGRRFFLKTCAYHPCNEK